MLVLARRAGAGAGRCGARIAETGELVAPYVWPQPPRAAAARRNGRARRQPMPRRPMPPTGCPGRRRRRRRRRSRCGPRRRWRSPTRAAAGGPRRALLAGARRGAGARARCASAAAGAAGRSRRGAARLAPQRMLQRDLLDDSAWRRSHRRRRKRVLADPALAELFGPESRAEVAIVGRVATAQRRLCGERPDRPAVRARPTGWHIVDFKTNRDVPATPAEVDPAYVAAARALSPPADGDGAGRRGAARRWSGPPGRTSCQSRRRSWNRRWRSSASAP